MKFNDLLSLFKQGKATARSHMKNLIEMAAADGNFDSIEMDLLKSIAKRNGISESQLKKIQSNPEGIEFEVPNDQKEKFHQFFDLVHMMSVDNAIHDDELKLCNLFGVKFGYKRERLKELIGTIRSNITNGLPPDEAYKRSEWLTK